ncbi:MAG: pantoate--beta-alanine ligase [Acidimicrobiales bacterium]
MELIRGRGDWQSLLELRREKGDRIGLVPTMGALHAGHLSLVSAAAEHCDFVAMTIFVNPLQFGDSGDLAAYPRDLGADLQLAADSGVDAVFAPSVEEMYPSGTPSTTVRPGRLADRLEGTARPSHFDGVATIVTKLFALTGPSTAFFGEKDFQQLAIVSRLVSDLDLPIEVVGCPIVREPDGLALSSRNRRLSRAERHAASVLFRSLEAGRRGLEEGADLDSAEESMRSELATEPLVRPDYAVAVDPTTLERPTEQPGPLRLLVAATVGPVRLIDNVAAEPVQRAEPAAPAELDPVAS